MAALTSTHVHPVARSESVRESSKSVVRSSRSCGYLTITAMTIRFTVILNINTTLMSTGIIWSKSVTSSSVCEMKRVHITFRSRDPQI